MPVLGRPAATAALAGLHLFHSAGSSCSQRVRLVLAEKGLSYDGHDVDLRAGGQLAPSYLAINPRGLVPALVLDGEVVVESVDILAYLEELFADPTLAGADHADGGRLTSRADDCQDALRTLTHEYLFRARPPAGRDALDAYIRAAPKDGRGDFFRSYAENAADWSGRVDDATDTMADGVYRLETILALRPWLEGGSFGIADVAWLPTIHRLAFLGWPLRRWPLLGGWYARASARPSFAAAIAAFEKPAEIALASGYVARRSSDGTGVRVRLTVDS